MKKVVIFDFDGTIADVMHLIYKYTPSFSKEFGLKKLTVEEVKVLRNKTIKEIIKELQIPLFKLPFILIKAKKIFNQEIKNIKLIKNIEKVLKGLKEKGYSLGILSSNSQENLNEFLDNHDIRQFFDFVHSEFNIFGKDKALKNLLEKHKINIKDVIYIGDEVRDIEACAHDKIAVIAVTWGLNTKEILQKYNPTYLVNKPEEILRILK